MQCDFRNAEFPVRVDTAITLSQAAGSGCQSVTQSIVSTMEFSRLVLFLLRRNIDSQEFFEEFH